MITIGMPVYEGVDLLDVAGPYEIFQWLNEIGQAVEVSLIAEASTKDITSRDGFTFKVQASFDDIDRLDVLWVPGGKPDALRSLMSQNSTYLSFLRDKAENARFVASVCEGALLLAAAKLLNGYKATTHWAFIPCLKRFPEVQVVEGYPRYFVDRNRITGGGISSGLDEALRLVEMLTSTKMAEQIQRITQYYPIPPVSSTITPATRCPFDW